MATIQDYGNGKWRIIVCAGRRPDNSLNRKSWTIEAKSRKAAEKKAAQLEYEFRNGKIKEAPKRCSFNDLLQEWRGSEKYRKLSPKSVERYEGMLKHKLIPAFGLWPLEDIKPLDISRLLASLGKPGARVDTDNQSPYSDKTIQGYYILLHTLFDKAVKWEMMSENVCDKVDKPSIKKHKAEFYEEEQINRLLECLDMEGEALEISLKKRNPNHRKKSEQEKRELMEERKYLYSMHKAYVYLALASTGRRSEVCGLDWTDINFDTKYLVMNETLQYTKGTGKFSTPYLKNGETYKGMYLPEVVIDILKEYRVEQQRYKEILGDKWTESGKVFTAVNGDLINPNNISLWFKRFLKKHQLPSITLHEVRHTSISYMLMQNVPIEVVAERAGHRDTSVTTGIYGHVFKSSKKKAAETIETMFTKCSTGAD